MFYGTGWSQRKMAQVQTEEKTLLKFSALCSAFPAVSRSSGFESECWCDPGDFLPCCSSPSWFADAQSICGLSKCPASPCCAVLRVLCSAWVLGLSPRIWADSAAEGPAQTSAQACACLWWTVPEKAKCQEIYKITETWENLAGSIPGKRCSCLSIH